MPSNASTEDPRGFQTSWVSVGIVLMTVVAGLSQACSDDEAPAKVSDLPPQSTIGSPCVPFEESFPQFPGSSEIAMYLDSEACGGEICLAYHFQGRVTCPYGQSTSDLNNPAADPARCRVTDAEGHVTAAPVTVEVLPQLVDRSPEDAVYCSCACSGTDHSRQYCTCPSDMVCEQLNSGLALKATTTGVCVRHDSTYDPKTQATKQCSRDATDATTDCGNNRANP